MNSFIVLIFAVLILVNPVFAEEDIKFTEKEAGRLIVEIEQGEICKDILKNKNVVIDNITKQTENYQEQLKICIEKNIIYEEKSKSQEIVIKTQEEEYQRIIDETKGSFWSRLKHNMGIFTAGSLTGILILGLVIIAL